MTNKILGLTWYQWACNQYRKGCLDCGNGPRGHAPKLVGAFANFKWGAYCTYPEKKKIQRVSLRQDIPPVPARSTGVIDL